MKLLITALLFTALFSSAAYAQLTLSSCISIQNAIKNIEKKRRVGGNAQYMAYLATRRKQLQFQFDDGNCTKYGTRLPNKYGGTRSSRDKYGR